MSIHYWLLTPVLLGVGFLFLMCSFPKHTNGIIDDDFPYWYCLDCVHVTSPSGLNISELAPDKINPDCLNAYLYNQTTTRVSQCASSRYSQNNPNEFCWEGYARAAGVVEVVEIYIRQCITLQPWETAIVMQTYQDQIKFNGTAHTDNFTVDWGLSSRSLLRENNESHTHTPLPKKMTEAFKIVSLAEKSKAGGKVLVANPVVAVSGFYLVCYHDAGCNSFPAEAMSDYKFYVTSSTTTATTTSKGSIQKPEAQLIVFFLWNWISASIVALNNNNKI